MRAVLPILRDGVSVPSLLEGKLYADFRIGRYAEGFTKLLETLHFDIQAVSILAGAPMKWKNIDAVCDKLIEFGMEVTEHWTPALTKAEITGGYLTYMRGDREATTRPGTFSPISPIPVAPDTKILTGCGVQVCFAVMRVDYLDKDQESYGNIIASFGPYRYILYVAGQAEDVKEALTFLFQFADSEELDYLKYDLPELLTWWDAPSLPASDPLAVSVSKQSR